MSSSSAQSPGNGGADSSFTAPSGFLTLWTVRLVWHGLPLVSLCWLFPATFFSVLCPETCSKRTHSMMFLGADMRLTGLLSPELSYWPFLKMGTMFAFLQLLGVSPDLHNLSNMIESSLARTTAISLGTLGCSLVGRMCGTSSEANADLILIHCWLFSSPSTFL